MGLRINRVRERGLFFAVVFISVFSALRLDAHVIRVQYPTNVVRGFEYRLDVEIREADGTMDTNWYGTVVLAAEGETVFDRTSVDVVKGKGLFPVFMKVISGDVAVRVSVSDSTGHLTGSSHDLAVFDPERISRSLIFSEIMVDTDNDKTDEWFELYNSSDQTIDLQYKTVVMHDSPTISRSYCHTIKPENRTLPAGQFQLFPGSYGVIVRDLDRFEELYPNIRNKITSSDPDYRHTIIIEAPGKSDSFNMPDSHGTVFLTDGTNLTSPVYSLLYYDSHWGGERNVSMERKSINILSSEKMNWSSSICQGGTPGRPNTVALAEDHPSKNEMELSSDIWIRDGVPLTIRFKSGSSLKDASIILVSSAGRKMVSFLVDAFLEKEKEYVFELSNRNIEGSRLPVGLYMIRLNARRENGSEINIYRKLVIGVR